MQMLRYTAFGSRPGAGNPAGVVLDASGLSESDMLGAAAHVGYSESAFLVPTADRGVFDVRYFSPLAEVPFCGHATIASAAAYAQRFGPGELLFNTAAGPIRVQTSSGAGAVSATLTSVPPSIADLDADDLRALLRALRWDATDLDSRLPPQVAFAGAYHPIVAVSQRSRLAALDYDFDALAALMATRQWTTVDLIWREATTSFHCRNPFPPGGIVEDPATGAAAAALGGYLRALHLVDPPAQITVEQGYDMGRPSRIDISIPAGEEGISVTGTAVELPQGA